MNRGLTQYIDLKLLRFILLVLFSGIASSLTGSMGAFLIVASVLFLNAFFYNNNPLTLFLAFIFLDSYSLVWGGDWGFFNLPLREVDVNMTQASNMLGYVVLVFVFLKRRRLPRLNSIDYWIMLFFALGVASPLWAVDPSESSFHAFRFLQFLILYILIRVLIRTPDDIELYFKYLVVSFIPLFAVILFQYSAGYFGEGYGEGRPGILASFLPYLLALTALPARNKWMLWLTIVLSVFLSTFHGSRRVFIGIVGYFALHFRLKKGAFILIITIALIGPYFYELIPSTTRSRLDSTFKQLTIIYQGEGDENTLNSLGTNRWEYWEYTWQMFIDYPLLGVGLKNQSKLLDDYGADHEARAHNFYLEVLADLGIVGFLILCMIIFYGFKALKGFSVGYFHSNTFLFEMVKAYKYQLIMIHVIAFFGNSMFYNKGAWVLYGLVGCIAGMAPRFESYVSRKKSSIHNEEYA